VPDPEVTGRAARRRFTVEYKRRILRAADACPRGELGALLRREGLYSSLLNEWRRQRERGEIAALAPKKRGRKGKTPDPLEAEVQRLRKEIERLRQRLQRTETILEIQKKASELLGIPLNPPKSDEAE
jgi:transposase-like protein